MNKELNIEYKEFVKNVETNPWFKALVYSIVKSKCPWCSRRFKPEERTGDMLAHFHTTHGFTKDLFIIKK